MIGFSRQTWFASRNAQAFLLAVLVTGLSAQVSESRPQVGVPEDWTHHRIKFNSTILREHPELASREPRAPDAEGTPVAHSNPGIVLLWLRNSVGRLSVAARSNSSPPCTLLNERTSFRSPRLRRIFHRKSMGI